MLTFKSEEDRVRTMFEKVFHTIYEPQKKFDECFSDITYNQSWFVKFDCSKLSIFKSAKQVGNNLFIVRMFNATRSVAIKI